MKRTNKAFTLVEVIIVIAVIGILAAILILALPKAIEEAHEKSAMSDAKNTLTETQIEIDPSDTLNRNYVIIVEKYGKEYVFSCEYEKELTPYESNPFGQCDRAELANSLCDMGLIQAPLGLSDIKLSEQFENVSLFTGGKLVNPSRIDVEVNCEIDLPECGILGVTWKTENTSVAGIRDGKIYGKSVGKTHLTAMSDNMRIAYDLYVGKRVDVTTFAELKAAVEDESESVFIHNGRDVDNRLPFYPEYNELPVTIHSGKYVKLCRDMITDWGDSEHPEFADYMRFDIEYNYDCNHGVDSFFINDGGTLVLDGVYISPVSAENEETGTPAGEMTGNIIINRNGGYVELDNDTSLGHSETRFVPINYALFGIPISPQDERYNEAMDYIRKKENSEIVYDIVNEDGKVLFDSSSVGNFYNGTNGIFNVKNTLKENNPALQWGCGAHYILNEGMIYSLDRMNIGCGYYLTCRTGIINRGTIYEITNSNFKSTRGITCIESEGSIFSIYNCTFEPSISALLSVEDLLEVEVFLPLSREQAEEFISRPLTALRIKGGKITRCSGCNFGYYDIVFEGTSPYAFITSGKFMYEPDGRMICEGKTVTQEDGIYIVE